MLLEVVNESGMMSWKPLFAALTLNDLLFYDAVPMLKSEWACPRVTRPLIATRVVQTTSRYATFVALGTQHNSLIEILTASS